MIFRDYMLFHAAFKVTLRLYHISTFKVCEVFGMNTLFLLLEGFSTPINAIRAFGVDSDKSGLQSPPTRKMTWLMPKYLHIRF